jgi:predicted permease
LFAQVFVEASTANPGFRVDNVLVATFDPNLAGYDAARTRAFYEELHKRAGALAGVRSASLASHVQLGPLDTSQAVVNAELDASDPRNARTIMYNLVTPDFFGTMDTPVLRGRALDVRDTAAAPTVAVVNQTMAKLLWPGQEPVGRRIRLTKFGKTAEVVGVARDGDYDDLQEAPQPYFYLAFAQHPQSRMSLMLHTNGDPASMAPAVRAEAQRIAPDLPIHELMTMRRMFEGMGLLIPKLTAQLVSLMALIGLALGVTGLYAIVAFAVNQRTREFGIRMALGASAHTILQGVLVGGLRIAGTGLLIGLGGAFLIADYFAPLLAHVNPRDPVIFVGVAGVLLTVALAACWIPARRASLVDPAVTLRQE